MGMTFEKPQDLLAIPEGKALIAIIDDISGLAAKYGGEYHLIKNEYYYPIKIVKDRCSFQVGFEFPVPPSSKFQNTPPASGGCND